jgi:hypothetical protein
MAKYLDTSRKVDGGNAPARRAPGRLPDVAKTSARPGRHVAPAKVTIRVVRAR